MKDSFMLAECFSAQSPLNLLSLVAILEEIAGISLPGLEYHRILTEDLLYLIKITLVFTLQLQVAE